MAENQESIFGFEKSPRNCHSSVDNKRKIEMWKDIKRANIYLWANAYNALYILQQSNNLT